MMTIPNDIMKTEWDKLKNLAQGCKRHPGYRYHRKPTTDCPICKQLYEDWQSIKDHIMDQDYDQISSIQEKV